MKQSRAQEQRFVPWAHDSQGIRLAITGGSLDSQTLEVADARAHVLDLCGAWQRARLALEISVSDRAAMRLIAAHERDAPPLAVLITLRCQATHLRRRIARLDWSAVARGLTLDADLLRAELAGSAELEAFLIRTRTLEDPAPGVAARVGARLAHARPWSLQIDDVQQRSGNYLDIQYRSFAGDPALPITQRSALYRLDLEREDPILYLNGDHERVRAVLDNKGTRGRRVRARELLYERIEAGVWTQLLIRVSARLCDDGELAYAWERAILDLWLPRLYPDASDDSARLDRLQRDYQHLPGLLSHIDATLQVVGELGDTATKLVDEL